ncbi:MAG TPA: sensor histidine kinase [Candidatus Ruania gallistercoris]|uniref:histidine kinase n=1 Tax=Candidatus Ruania gallistercoris TaxID=2838746 RepID=A0A9D2EFU9_9MICO|nr:sensor histidine kinase [Candidatus Ruania gallistercoris]
MTASNTRGASLDALLARPLVADAVLAVLLATVLGPMSASLLRSAVSPAPVLLTATGCLLVLHVGVLWRRRAPVLTYLLTAAAMLTLVLLPPLQDSTGVAYATVLLPSSMLFALMLYTVAGQVHRGRALVALGIALIGVVVVLVRLWDPASWGGSTGSSGTWVWRLGLAVALSAVMATVWALGRLSGTRRLFLEGLREKAERAEQDRLRERAEAARAERDRIRREMHDVVSHSLAVIVSHAEGGRMQDPDGPGASAFATIGHVGRESLRDMRALLGVLQEGDSGTEPAPRLADLPDLVERVRAAGLEVAVEQQGTAHELRPAVHLAAFRVVQEALTNVFKHAGAGARATVRLTWQDEQVVLTITDDGAGARVLHAGVGLTGMQERTRLVGGTLDAGHRDQGGFEVRATLPHEGRRSR